LIIPVGHSLHEMTKKPRHVDNFPQGCNTDNMAMQIQTSDPTLLTEATRTAEEFVKQCVSNDTAGIAFLGAIVRGYFDRFADIDIALMTKNSPGNPEVPQYQKLNGFEVHCNVANIDQEASSTWDMAKRWAFSESRIYHDPEGRMAKLLFEKVPLRPEERRWLLISGITLSEWYINRLTDLWIARGSVVSAHCMFSEGLNHFINVLFGLNNQLVADHKWRYYYAERLKVLPSDFQLQMEKVVTLHASTEDEVKRRKAAFMGMWHQMLPLVEKEVMMNYEDFKDTV
jgi:hypothetical protein